MNKEKMIELSDEILVDVNGGNEQTVISIWDKYFVSTKGANGNKDIIRAALTTVLQDAYAAQHSGNMTNQELSNLCIQVNKLKDQYGISL